MNDELDPELAGTAAPAATLPPAPAPVTDAAPAPVVAPVTSIAVDPAAREAAVQAAIDATKAHAAPIQAAAAAEAARVPEPTPAPAPAATLPPELAEEPEPIDETCVDLDAPLPSVSEFRAIQAKVVELEEHIEELVRHLAQSFGGEFSAKKDRMGV